MGLVERGKVFSRLEGYFQSQRMQVEELSDLREVGSLAEGAQKQYLSSYGSPYFNDFSDADVLWISVKQEGVPVFVGSARLETVRNESVSRYWSRVFERHHNLTFSRVRPEVDEMLTGSLAYFGDLHVNPQRRGARKSLQAFLVMAHVLVSLKWDPDWSYCFVPERHVMLGNSALYGFTHSFCTPIHWDSPPVKPRTSSDWLLAAPRSSVLPTAHNVLSGLGVEA